MKYILTVVLTFFITITSFSQEVITDKNFTDKVKGNRAFDDRTHIVVVEFWASFNDKNSFKEWKKLEGVEYYRCDVSLSPDARSKYSVRTLPYLIVFKEGYEELKFKAGLDYKIKLSVEEIQSKINELNTESKF